VDIGIEDLRLVHSAGISKRARTMIRSDSRADAYCVARRAAEKTDESEVEGLEPRERAAHMIVG
jgi:hypothetical protein